MPLKGRRAAVLVRGTNVVPPHVQGILNQEKRVLEQTLEYLDREAAYNIRTVSQQQQVLQRSLQLLQIRLKISQERSQAVLNKPHQTDRVPAKQEKPKKLTKTSDKPKDITTKTKQHAKVKSRKMSLSL